MYFPFFLFRSMTIYMNKEIIVGDFGCMQKHQVGKMEKHSAKNVLT